MKTVSVVTVKLTNAEQKKLERELMPFIYPTPSTDKLIYDQQLEQFVSRSYQVVASALSPETLHVLFTLKSRREPPAVVIIKNCPLDPWVPPTPPSGRRSDYFKPTSISEAFLTGIASTIGEPIGHMEEKEGCLLHDIIPISNSNAQLSNEGHERFGLHSENASFVIREKFVLLLGLRADHDHVAETPVADVRLALKRLSEETIYALYQPEFIIRKPYILDSSTVRQYSEPVALLSGPLSAPEVRATFYTEGTKALTPVAEEAKKRFSDALDAVVVPLKIEEGTLVILHNYLCVHGRTPFTPRFDGYDRHLLRSYVLPDLWCVRELQTHATRIIERAKSR